MRWRIYYIDGSTYSNEDGSPESAPGFGVAAIAQEDALVGVQIHQQKDFYAFSGDFGGWYGLDHFGLAQYLGRPGTKIVKLGDCMPTNKYRALVESLNNDPGLPAKSARYPWEAPIG